MKSGFWIRLFLVAIAILFWVVMAQELPLGLPDIGSICRNRTESARASASGSREVRLSINATRTVSRLDMR